MVHLSNPGHSPGHSGNQATHMTDHTFSDTALRDFLADGYTLIGSDHAPEYHQDMCERLDRLIEREGNPGNNVLPCVPQIQQVFEAPKVASALTRILGPGYIMHPHRHCHHRPPGSKPQGWHKDDYVYDQNVRHHRGRWVMAFYYPQAVTADMGPTSIVPRQQHHDTMAGSEADPTLEMAITGTAGTVAIVNFDIWHRACANVSPHNRYMLKFQFLRMDEPAASPAPTSSPDAVEWGATDHTARHQWNWLHGNSNDDSDGPGSLDSGHSHGADDDMAMAIATLRSDSDPARLQATYALARMGARVVPTLVDALRDEAEEQAEAKTAKCPANPAGGNPADLATAHALAALGPPAIDALVNLTGDDHWAVRATAVDVLGTIGKPARVAVDAIRHSLQDDNLWVRRNAAEALGTLNDVSGTDDLTKVLADEDWRVRLNAVGTLARIGPQAAPSTAAVSSLLDDENRYVQANALQALRRFDTSEATDALMSHLMSARWCAVTSKDNPY